MKIRRIIYKPIEDMWRCTVYYQRNGADRISVAHGWTPEDAYGNAVDYARPGWRRVLGKVMDAMKATVRGDRLCDQEGCQRRAKWHYLWHKEMAVCDPHVDEVRRVAMLTANSAVIRSIRPLTDSEKKVTPKFTPGLVMTCVMCGKQEVSLENVSSDWRCLEADGVDHYVCTDHFPPDGSSAEAFAAAYTSVIKFIQEKS